MGYPMRWDQIAAPQIQEQAVPVEAPAHSSLRAYFLRLTIVSLVGATVLVLTVIGGCTVFFNGRQRAALQLEQAPAQLQAVLSRPTAVRRVGYVAVTGNVVNRTAHTLTHIEAVVELYDAQRHILRVDSAMVEREAIAPGQSSPFDVTLRDDARAVGYRVYFKRLLGPPLN